MWISPEHRVPHWLHIHAQRSQLGDDLPQICNTVGAGDLAAMLGCPWHFTPNTVWFEPIAGEPKDWPSLAFTREQIEQSGPFQQLRQLVEAGLEQAAGRVYVGMPDLVENFDIYSSLRGPQTALLDLYDQPEVVEQRLWEINEAFYAAFDAFYDLIRDDIGGNVFSAFNLWGPGKTAKVQCDACAMFGPEMFRKFVAGPLTAQCEWLDYAMYHLDGEECWPNLDVLLEIEALRAIEWTPKFAYTGEGGGHPKWYELYRRILAAGKSVQAISVTPDEVIPLLDAVGGEGMYIMCKGQDLTPDQAARLREKAEAYRYS